MKRDTDGGRVKKKEAAPVLWRERGMMGGAEKVWETSVLRQALEAESKPQSDLNSQLRNLIITRAGSRSEQDVQWVKAIWEEEKQEEAGKRGSNMYITFNNPRDSMADIRHPIVNVNSGHPRSYTVFQSAHRRRSCLLDLQPVTPFLCQMHVN